MSGICCITVTFSASCLYKQKLLNIKIGEFSNSAAMSFRRTTNLFPAWKVCHCFMSRSAEQSNFGKLVPFKCCQPWSGIWPACCGWAFISSQHRYGPCVLCCAFHSPHVFHRDQWRKSHGRLHHSFRLVRLFAMTVQTFLFTVRSTYRSNIRTLAGCRMIWLRFWPLWPRDGSDSNAKHQRYPWDSVQRNGWVKEIKWKCCQSFKLDWNPRKSFE